MSCFISSYIKASPKERQIEQRLNDVSARIEDYCFKSKNNQILHFRLSIFLITKISHSCRHVQQVEIIIKFFGQKETGMPLYSFSIRYFPFHLPYSINGSIITLDPSCFLSSLDIVFTAIHSILSARASSFFIRHLF